MFRRIAIFLVLGLVAVACGSSGGEVTTGEDGNSEDPVDSVQVASSVPDDSDADLDDQPLGGGIGAIGSVEITISHPETQPVTYTIGCFGDAFPVTPAMAGIDGATACERLAVPEVQDRLLNGPSGQICTEIYGGPDEAHIVGEIDGQAVDAVIDRANGCGIDDWDQLLAGVLPLAKGV